MMKRFAFLIAVLMAAILPATSHAEWVDKEIFWQMSSRGTPFDGTGIYVRDTSFTVIQGVAAALDTTGEFSLNYASCPFRGGTGVSGATSALAPSGSDTCNVAYLMFSADSSAAPTTPTLTSATILIDGAPPGKSTNTTLAGNWQRADSIVVNSVGTNGTYPLAAGSTAFAVPIRTIGPYGHVQRFSIFRARISAATGILSGSVRVWLRYWRQS